MMIRAQRFNTYLMVAVAAGLAGWGCQSIEKLTTPKLLSSLRLFIESPLDGTAAKEKVPIYREKPVWVTIDQLPVLTEGNVMGAIVVDEVGGYALKIQFDRRGTELLEQLTSSNRGRRVAILSQFGEKIKDYRWLAAPIITRRISDGVLVFTPDATREEAEEIARGLNNVSKKVHRSIDK
jgi:preprotein translocase subunit SecD